MSTEYVTDVCEAAIEEMRYYKWQQSEDGMMNLVKKIVKAGDVVCDPYCGAGSTGIAAIEQNCRFIGNDIDKKCTETTRALLLTAAARQTSK